MTALLDTPETVAGDSACTTPGKRAFGSQLEALAFAAEYDDHNGTDNTPYGTCPCGRWHNTTTPHGGKRKPQANPGRIELLAAGFPDAPLRPTADLTVGFFTLTPKTAAFWLTHSNGHNRNVRGGGVSALSVDIITGGWELNGDTIRFNTDGVLIDGQHRCEAVARSGIPVPIILATGLEPTAQDTVDTGMRRLFADVLKLAGESDPNNLAAITLAVCRWKTDMIRNGGFHASTKVLQRVLNDHPELRRECVTSRQVKTRLGSVPGSVVGLASWLFRAIEEDDHADFFEKLMTGAGLEKDHPVLTLREALLRNAAAKAKLPKTDILAFFIKSWNAYRGGTAIHVLRYNGGGAKPEAFPVPR